MIDWFTYLLNLLMIFPALLQKMAAEMFNLTAKCVEGCSKSRSISPTIRGLLRNSEGNRQSLWRILNEFSEMSAFFFCKFEKKIINEISSNTRAKFAEFWKLHYNICVALETCCKMSLQLLNFVLIQPRAICLKLKSWRFLRHWLIRNE